MANLESMICELERFEAYMRDLERKRPFEDYLDQPDEASRKRRQMLDIPLALPEKPK